MRNINGRHLARSLDLVDIEKVRLTIIYPFRTYGLPSRQVTALEDPAKMVRKGSTTKRTKNIILRAALVFESAWFADRW